MCLIQMGVDVPAAAVVSSLQQQAQWEKDQQKRSTKEYLHKRYKFTAGGFILNILLRFPGTFRNERRRHGMSGRRS